MDNGPYAVWRPAAARRFRANTLAARSDAIASRCLTKRYPTARRIAVGPPLAFTGYYRGSHAKRGDGEVEMSDYSEVLARAAELSNDASPENGADPLFERALKRVGTSLRDKWRLDALLGVGAAAAVYAATHRNGSRGAVKLLHPEMSTNAFVRERFLCEGFIANAVEHEGVIKVIDDDTAEDGSLFLVTELLDGETLEGRRVRLGGRIPQDEVLLIVHQLLCVLAAVHAKGIVHRDLKPENVYLTRRGQVKLLDFGIAQLPEMCTKSNCSQTGMVVGTPAYMPPEQARGLSKDVDAQSDLWACGAMMFFLLSGRGVHDAGTVDNELRIALHRRAPSLASAAPDVATAVARVVDRALEFSKERRWPSAAAMNEAVQQAYQALCGHPIESPRNLTRVNRPVDGELPGPPPVSSQHAKVLTTTRPVALCAASGAKLSGQRASRGAAAVGVLAFGIAVVGTVWMVPGRPGVRALPVYVAAPATALRQAPPSAPIPPAVRVPNMPPDGVLSPSVAPEIGVAREARRERTDQAVLQEFVTRSRPAPTPLVVATAVVGMRRSEHRSTFPPVPLPAPLYPPTETIPTKEDCQPPYVVDTSTGNKRWRLECL
jgi:eukaryotic-like serine/threonine-protein kinase